MKRRPFRNGCSRPEWFSRPYVEKCLAIRSEVFRRIESLAVADDGRRGFGSVYARGPLRQTGLTLGIWNWAHAKATEYPSQLEARYYSYDPLCLDSGTPFAERRIVADAFVAVANEMFDSEDVQFASRPLEVIAASPDKPAGIYPGDDADVLAVELFVGVPMPKIIDTFAEIHWLAEKAHHIRPDYTCLVSVEAMQFGVWHHVDRVNAAREVLGLNLPPIKVPGIAALRRRGMALQDAADAAWRQRNATTNETPPPPAVRRD